MKILIVEDVVFRQELIRTMVGTTSLIALNMRRKG